MKTTTKTLATLTVLLMAACGGGDKTSDGGGQNTGSQSTNTSDATNAGDSGSQTNGTPPTSTTYNGSGTLTLTAIGVTSFTRDFDIKIVITGSTVKATVEGESATTTLNGNKFTFSIPVSESKDGITCNGTAKVEGTVNGNSISGSIGGSGDCSGVTVVLSGSYSASS